MVRISPPANMGAYRANLEKAEGSDLLDAVQQARVDHKQGAKSNKDDLFARRQVANNMLRQRFGMQAEKLLNAWLEFRDNISLDITKLGDEDLKEIEQKLSSTEKKIDELGSNLNTSNDPVSPILNKLNNFRQRLMAETNKRNPSPQPFSSKNPRG